MGKKKDKKKAVKAAKTPDFGGALDKRGTPKKPKNGAKKTKKTAVIYLSETDQLLLSDVFDEYLRGRREDLLKDLKAVKSVYAADRVAKIGRGLNSMSDAEELFVEFLRKVSYDGVKGEFGAANLVRVDVPQQEPSSVNIMGEPVT